MAVSSRIAHFDEYIHHEEIRQLSRCADDNGSGFSEQTQKFEEVGEWSRKEAGAFCQRYVAVETRAEGYDGSTSESDAMVPLGMDHFWKIYGGK